MAKEESKEPGPSAGSLVRMDREEPEEPGRSGGLLVFYRWPLNVMLPVAPVLLTGGWFWSEDSWLSDDERYDPAFLVRELSIIAYQKFTTSEHGQKLFEQGHSLEHIIGRHKKQILQLGDEGDEALLKQANSDRPFFALKHTIPPQVEGDEPKEQYLFYMYCAMGLPQQHDWQQALLARCKDFHAAACILLAIKEVLDVSVYPEQIFDTSNHPTAFEEFNDVLTSEKVPIRKGERFLLRIALANNPTPPGTIEAFLNMDGLLMRQR